MLKFAVILSVIFIVTMADNLSDEQQWSEFKTKHNKSYSTPEEESSRFAIFQQNLQKINAHNEKYAKGEVTYTMGINAFADLTPEEFQKKYTGGVRPLPTST